MTKNADKSMGEEAIREGNEAVLSTKKLNYVDTRLCTTLHEHWVGPFNIGENHLSSCLSVSLAPEMVSLTNLPCEQV